MAAVASRMMPGTIEHTRAACEDARRQLVRRRTAAATAVARARAVRLRGGSPRRGTSDPATGRSEAVVEARIQQHLGLARALAARYARRGEPVEDLEQVAMLALVKAARRYDPSREVPFAGYATPSILGELKRHFRDRAWTLRVPRSTQERYLQVIAERDALLQEHGRVPTLPAIAERIGCSTEDVVEAMEAGDNYRPASIDALADGRRSELPSDDGGFDRALDHAGLVTAMAGLDDQERRILELRFVEDWPQRRIAAELGVSQMHVSRLLARLFVRLREDLRG